MTYDNTNRGQIWGNETKKKDTDPDFKGSINVEGVEYWFSAWKRKPDAHPKAPALSFSIQKKKDVHDKGVEQVSNTVAPPPMDDLDEVIPF
jgi:transposase